MHYPVAMRRCIFITLLLSFCLGASCGSDDDTASSGQGESSSGSSEAGETPSAGASASADSVPLPELPELAEAPEVERTAPSIVNLSSARQALEAGFYEEVRSALPRLGDTPEAKLFRAELAMATGQYEEAESLAGQAATGPDANLVRRAKTLQAEAKIEQGEYEEAEGILRPMLEDRAAHRAHLKLGFLLSIQGRRVEAEPVLMQLIRSYNDGGITQQNGEGLAYVGEAAWLLGSVRDANDAFLESGRADGERNETQLVWARLFLDNYDAGHAEESVREVLGRNPNHAVANALMAKIRIAQNFNFAAAEELVAKALAVNPNLAEAHVVNAGMALRDLDTQAADEHIAAALRVNPHNLEALSTRAAARFLADDEAGFEAAKREVLRRHRTYSRMYNIIGEYAEWEHRYPDIVEMSREAVTLNSSDHFAHAALGLNLLRMGDEAAAREALQNAWRRDRYNVRVYNTLNLYDEIIPAQYSEFADGPFVFRMHNEERPLLERYVPRTLRGAYDDMRRRYNFTPEGPLRIEMFADVQHFSLRTMGLPNLGVQGVCFGKVVTAISPAGGPFNWGQITWHELAHVFHIQLSQNHVPRWFTEGLAEYETLIVPNMGWRREMDHHLWHALQNDRLPPLRLMNRAFTRARSPMDMMVAYYASTRIVKYIADEHGFDKVVQMLRLWGAGHRTREVVQRALGLELEELDEAFRAHARARLQNRGEDFQVDFGQYRELDELRAAAEANPRDADAQAGLAAGLLINGDADGATAAANAALGIRSTQPVALFVLARLAIAQQNLDGAGQRLQALVDGGHDGYEVRLLMARLALLREQGDAAKEALLAATRIDVDRGEAWMGLVEIATTQEDEALLTQALTNLARIDEHDRATHARLLERLVRAGQWDQALIFGERAPFVDPGNAVTHGLLARVYEHFDRDREALYEWDSALIAEHPSPGQVNLGRARALRALGQQSEAAEAARAATAADASLADEARPFLQP